MDENSESVSEDVEHERRTKQKHESECVSDEREEAKEDDAMDQGVQHSSIQKVTRMAKSDVHDESAPEEIVSYAAQEIHESRAKGESRSQADNTNGRYRKRKHPQMIEIASDDADEASNKQSRSKFQKKFTVKDDKKILKALLKNGYTCGTRAFWRTVNDSLKLSIPVNQTQLYEVVRRLRGNYFKRLRTGNANLAMSHQERKLHKLSEKIWGKEEKPESEDYEKNPQDDDDFEMVVHDYGEKFEKFTLELRKNNYDCDKFPVAEALDIVSGRKRSELQRKWEELHVSKIQLSLRTFVLIGETMEAAKSSPSYPRTTSSML